MDSSLNEIKKKMMKLWKDTFHDSDAYVSLIFENYFDPELIEVHEDKNQIVSALLGVPYYFSNGEQKIKGLYLCGLATKDEFRQKGIMTDLINRINKKAIEKGYAISFLIPASDSLRIYYQNKGYVNGIYRIEDRYTSIHDFEKDGLSEINREDERIRKYRQKYFTELNTEVVDSNDTEKLRKISEYIRKNEQEKREYLTLQHDDKDIDAVIKENFISGGKIVVTFDKNETIKGVEFITEDNRGEIHISKIYYDDKCAYYKLLDKAKKIYPDAAMGVWRYPEEVNRKLVWSQNFIPGASDGINTTSYGTAERVYDAGMHSQPYGMVKILNLSEILKFIAKDNNNLKFSILVKKETSDSTGDFFEVNSGKVEFREGIKEETVKQSRHSGNFSILSHRDLAEIIFRKKDTHNLIMEAFGIPRIPLNMSLMLD